MCIRDRLITRITVDALTWVGWRTRVAVRKWTSYVSTLSSLRLVSTYTAFTDSWSAAQKAVSHGVWTLIAGQTVEEVSFQTLITLNNTVHITTSVALRYLRSTFLTVGTTCCSCIYLSFPTVPFTSGISIAFGYLSVTRLTSSTSIVAVSYTHLTLPTIYSV